MAGYRRGLHLSHGERVPTIDFDSEEERDRCMRMLRLLDQLGGEDALRAFGSSERSGTMDLEEVARRMRELRNSLRSQKDGVGS